MEAPKYFTLRTEELTPPDAAAMGDMMLAATPSASKPTRILMEAGTFTSAERDDRLRDSCTLGAAGTMPLSAGTPVARPASTGVTWGVQAVGAAASSMTGKGVKVAVLDTGIDPTHPAFAGVTLTRKISQSKAMMIATAMAPIARARSLAAMLTACASAWHRCGRGGDR